MNPINQFARVSACALGAIAVLSLFAGAAVGAVPVATTFKESGDGIGHMLVVPYYTVQGGNATLLNIVNTDKTNGKAVKVRFRGASNADDVFNFTLFLSPGDVWAAEVSQNPGNGLARLYTPDDSCTLPTNVNRDFTTARLDLAASLANVANESREGYVDIITMADLVPGTAVYTATKHVNGKLPAACSQGAAAPAALHALLTEDGISAADFSTPTTGLFANWSIFNVADATSWAGAATALVATDSQGVAGAGKVVVHPQAVGAPSGIVRELTSDPLHQNGVLVIQHFDLPDLSTPYLAGRTAMQQAAILSGALAKETVRNEYFIDKNVQAYTDWVFTLPTRRYSVGVDYIRNHPVYTALAPAYFNDQNVRFLTGDELQFYGACVEDNPDKFWGRSGKETSDEFVTPVAGSARIVMCGAVSVWTIDAIPGLVNSVLNASVSRGSRVLGYGDPAGWGEVRTPGVNNAGLPLIGAAFAKATSANIGSGVSGNFGLTWPHRFTRPGSAVR